MKKDLLFLVVIITLLFLGCSSSKESTGVWINKEKIQGKAFHKAFIVVLTADIEARMQLENDLAAVAISRGHEAVKSLDMIPFNLQDPKVPTRDQVVSKVKESGCDAVFVAALLKKDESVHYEPGKTAYAIQPYYTYYSAYYSNWYPTVSTKDYYAHDKSYFMQSNFYDAASEEIMWSVQSDIFNPSSIKEFSRTYTSTLIKQLEKAELLKKK